MAGYLASHGSAPSALAAASIDPQQGCVPVFTLVLPPLLHGVGMHPTNKN